MAKKQRTKRQPIDHLQVLRRLQSAGIDGLHPINRPSQALDKLPTLQERINQLFNIIQQPSRPATNMLFFVMYDIESDKVRYHVVKYLERQGCLRIQKSIFLADTPAETYQAIKTDLAEVQSLYENHDSIIICPVSTDLLQAMSVIGKSVSLDIILKNKNTLFF